MMLRVVSSMNSTRTWVTPPREPARDQKTTLLDSFPCVLCILLPLTSTAEHSGNFDELDGDSANLISEMISIHACQKPLTW